MAILALFVCTLLGVAVAWKLVLVVRAREAPHYKDGFAEGRLSEWKTYGGTWSVRSGVLENSSGERGAKITTGSPKWKNYLLEADVQLLGRGDAGLIARVSHAEEGVDAYRGYYVGLRSHDDSLLVGQSDFRFLSFPTTPMPGGVHALQWYHLTLRVDGCEITGSATLLPNGPSVARTQHEEHCEQAGEIGLRSYASGGLWRNVRVSSLTSAQATSASENIQGDAAALSMPVVQDGSHDPQETAIRTQRPAGWTAPVAISDLRWVTVKERPLHIRGTVVATSPALFVQDPSGGVLVQEANGAPLSKVGDEVDVSGTVEVREHTVALIEATVTTLWAGSPLPPVSITDAQAASGTFDAQYVEIDGVVTGQRRISRDQTLLELSSDHQTFAATVPNEAISALTKLDDQSRVRLRGICLVDPAFTNNAYAFVLALHSSNDIELLAGPPWWTPVHLLMIGIALTTFALCLYAVRVRIRRSQLKAILDERERLAHEMHDTLAQSIAGIGFQLSAVRNRVPDDSPQFGHSLDVALQMVRHIHDEARRNIATLRPESLQDLSLSAGLLSNAERMIDGGQVRLKSELSGTEREIPLRVKDTLFRIGYEALANAMRHSGARCICIRVAYQPNSVRVEVEDNGIGFHEFGAAGGFGIVGMRKRAKSIGATFSVTHANGGGTVIECCAPLKKANSWWSRMAGAADLTKGNIRHV